MWPPPQLAGRRHLQELALPGVERQKLAIQAQPKERVVDERLLPRLQWRQRDPIPRLRAYMIEHGLATEEDLNAMDAVVERIIDEAVRFAEESPEPPPEELWTDVYAGVSKETHHRLGVVQR